jgi:hypothetical protein
MVPQRHALERRILTALESSPTRVPVLLGGCGSGRSTLLLRVADQIGRAACQYVDVERVATTPERFLRAVVDASPFAADPIARRTPASAREAFDLLIAFLGGARAPGGAPATFLLDEVLELRTFESFPGLRAVLRDLVAALGSSDNRFVVATRYTARARRLLRDAVARFEIVHVPPLTLAEVQAALVAAERHAPHESEEVARALHALADGRPVYVRAILEALTAMDRTGAGDPISAFAAQLAPGGALAIGCRFCYELRLHRARGYGALKAILDVLAEDEPLTLTEIASRLRRTPGSTKDYLSWLEDVDLVSVRQKRYSFEDPVLRLWVHLHCRTTAPSDEEVAREVGRYALARLPQGEPALALAGAPAAGERDKSWGIIEID